MQREIMGAEIKWHADRFVRQLLRGVDRRIRRHDDRGVSYNAAPADLAAARACLLHATIVAPFTGIVEIGLTLLEQLAVAGERVDASGACDVHLRLFLHPFFAVRPLDREPFLLE